MSAISNKYATARFVLSLLAFVGWAVFVIGTFLLCMGAILGFAGSSAFIDSQAGVSAGPIGGMVLGALPGLFLTVTGLAIVASHQVGRAVVDGSIVAQETADLLREQRDDSYKPNGPTSNGVRSSSRRTPPPISSPSVA